MICVFSNTIILAMDGLVSEQVNAVLVNMNFTFTAIFGAEMLLKLYGLGLKGYCMDYFNVFDGLVVILSIVELVVQEVVASDSGSDSGGTSGTSGISAFRAVRIFRIFRVLRVSRLLRSLRFMKVIVEVVGGTLEQFTYISMLLFLMIYIVSLLGMEIFGSKFDFPNQIYTRQNFDSFWSAF